MIPKARFAPSPTGLLHIGNARSAVINWAYIKNKGGDFILRIDDTDLERCKKEYEDKIKVGKLNVDDNPSTATKYGIRGIPTLLFFKDGKVIQQVTGVKSKAEIKKIIDESLV